jgi:hypothetical protein
MKRQLRVGQMRRVCGRTCRVVDVKIRLSRHTGYRGFHELPTVRITGGGRMYIPASILTFADLPARERKIKRVFYSRNSGYPEVGNE